ncbi:AAA family ATPase, partial [Escherichia coli]|uniref:AAA family ATPase n=1 Tax=Escherichia coli TaxID=562 RepID=UPI003D80E0D4
MQAVVDFRFQSVVLVKTADHLRQFHFHNGAHRDVMNLFYQVFDRGFMRDGEGREIDFRNTVILMTANLGSDHIMQLLEEKPDATDADLHELLYPLLRDHFQPALMARFQTVIYRPLGQEAMRTIVEMKLAQVVRRLHQHYGL